MTYMDGTIVSSKIHGTWNLYQFLSSTEGGNTYAHTYVCSCQWSEF